MSGVMFINNAVNFVAEPGQAEWTHSSGTFTWIVPNGVYEISAVCIGGGGGGAASGVTPATGGSGGNLLWANKIPVTPGEALTVTVGGGGGGAQGATTGGGGGNSIIARGATTLMSAGGGGGGVTGVSAASGKSADTLPTVTSDYGLEYGGPSTTTSATASERCSGGGGAAGYSTGTGSFGSSGVNNTGTSASSTTGGGSGGTGGISNDFGGGGGGTGPWGKGSNGTGVTGSKTSGVGGSLGNPSSGITSITVRTATQWAAGGNGVHGGLFGGGGGGGLTSNPGTAGGFGARGCVRIIWGNGRSFPNNAGNVDSTGTAVATSQQVYTTPGTYSWVVPVGVTQFSFVMVGGGGAGNQGSSTVGKGGGGGGGLTYGSFRCTPGETYTVVAGAGGTSTAFNTSTAGGTSSITRNISFKGFISGTSLYVTELISSTVLQTNATYSGTGATNFTITGFVTGERGKLGTYTVSVSQTVGSLESPVTFSSTVVMATATGGGAPAAAGTGAGTGGSAGTGTYTSDPAFALGGASYNGGTGGNNNTSTTAFGAGGGGAAGYGGNGAAGAAAGSAANGAYPQTGAASTFPGSAASGANGSAALLMGAGGGGVGIYGWGLDPNILNFTNTAGPTVSNQGYGGSGGTDGQLKGGTGAGGNYGGGGAGAGSFSAGRSSGGSGAVRITWGRVVYPGPTVDV